MTLRHRFTLRSVSAGAVLGLAASTAVVLGTPGTASAAPIDFACTVPILGPKTFVVDVTTNAPTSVPAGTSIAPMVTTTLTVPADLADTIRGPLVGANEISGTIQATNLVDGTEVPTTITIPSTNIGTSGPAVLTGTGVMDAIAAGAAGTTHQISAGEQSVTMTLYKDGVVVTPPININPIPCAPAPGSNTLVSTFTSRATSSTAVKAKFAKKARKATATATVSAAGVTPTGTVTFTLKKGAKQVKTVTATVVGGQAKATFKKLKKKGKYTVTASYGGAPAATASSGTATFKVR